eukprot:5482794-Pyramimonas_sp.AAC.1
MAIGSEKARKQGTLISVDFGRILASSGRPWGALWPFGAVLGRSWGLLEHLGCHLEASYAILSHLG